MVVCSIHEIAMTAMDKTNNTICKTKFALRHFTFSPFIQFKRIANPIKQRPIMPSAMPHGCLGQSHAPVAARTDPQHANMDGGVTPHSSFFSIGISLIVFHSNARVRSEFFATHSTRLLACHLIRNIFLKSASICW